MLEYQFNNRGKLARELRKELPHLSLGPRLGAIIAAAIHISGSVTAVERTPFNGIARVTPLILRANMRPAACRGLRWALGRAAVVLDECVTQRPAT